MKRILTYIILAMLAAYSYAVGVGGNGMYQWSVELTGYISPETGKAPNAYLWVPENCEKVKAIVLAQQNMTEETLFKMPSFQEKMSRLGVGLLWVAPAFSNNWEPSSGCQSIFEDMITAIAYQSGHEEICTAPIIPLGHSAQATFPWNFAAWNPGRTLCIISFHGDAPRTNLCGYGTANVEWGRTRNIDGIPGLMVEGEYEWWEARVRPALAFRMMYPESCISFLADTGRGHFDCSARTADYLARFIAMSLQERLLPDGTLRKINPRDGWLVDRYRPDLPENDGTDQGTSIETTSAPAPAAPYADYKGDPHDAFWYFDQEMAHITENRHRESIGKKMQYVGFEYNGKLIPYDEKAQGGMVADFIADKDGITMHIKAVYTNASHTKKSEAHAKNKPYIEVISGPIKKIDDTTFRIYPYEAGWDNPRRSFTVWLVAVGDADSEYRGCVQPLQVRLPKDIARTVSR